MKKKASLLEQTAAAAGISASYLNAYGQPEIISDEVKQQLLSAMQFTLPDNKEGGPLPPVIVLAQNSAFSLPLTSEAQWQLTLEQGELQQGKVAKGKPLKLPTDLPCGYHQLTLTQGSQQWSCRIIVTPERCYEPAPLHHHQKLWGTCVQMYTLRSDRNWGIGDFGDVQQLLKSIAKRGGTFVGLNPIHALYPANPEFCSPYSPSSRRWLNIIYIDINQVDDFQHSAEAQKWWQKAATQKKLAELRKVEWVDYTGVMSLKLAALKLAYQQFITRPERDKSQREFSEFVAHGGDDLRYHAIFDALSVHLVQSGHSWQWYQWPVAYQDSQNPEVSQFAQKHAFEVEFYLWLQWLAHHQLSACYRLSRKLKMSIGLYRDLAVGVAQESADAWKDRSLYCFNASVGAPPDILGPLGQNWALPPMSPHVMVERAYQPFIDLLRGNMTQCGALRIDHVMSLLRLWWIPQGESAKNGAYVHYPVDDLLAILALESQRHHCMVIGEDLGIVPKDIVSKLSTSGVYSYKILFFEQDDKNQLTPPENYLPQAMATATTHDMPTLKGYWQCGDLVLGKQLGLYPNPLALAQIYQERELTKQGILNSLHRYNCVPKSLRKTVKDMPMSPALNRGLLRYLALTESALVGIQLEDLLDMSEPVNIPGTYKEYPNWRRKLTDSLENMFADSSIRRLLSDLNSKRLLAASRKPKRK
ncbi:4-alpha-glucanotransferase [Jinshanibacter sp. LJY008]|uniref:4-alpha-glucanotransferase n=1 Tax=Limnobaculum eriocheiris TaxID=2897391 RepID=A0A9X1MVA4_9GAMM|nr:4-alpha-glucanotransferase [Limnobaculum eriocheiris]MCD1126286.1 4-alpha-glucanotransferase [Limnobaculum eriocheiris]